MERMPRRVAAVAAIAFFLALNSGAYLATAADSGWVSVQQVSAISRTARAKGEIPVSIQCRNASAKPGVTKPEMRVVTAPNADKRNWVFYTADHEYQPGAGPAEWTKWKKVSGNVLKTGSGLPLHCSLYHNKQAGSVDSRPPPISRRTGLGLRILH
jgi:hypothetical protein